MSVPVLGQSPAAGARVAEGALVVSFSLGSGNDLRLSIGTERGDNDVGSYAVSLPSTVSFTVPSVPVLWCSAWVTNTSVGTYHTYTWAWSVGDGTRAPSQVEHETEIGYIVDNWKRTALAGYAQGIEVADPGHGQDEVCPITVLGQPFDVEVAGHVSPFTTIQVTNRSTGTGYLRCLLRPLRDPVIVSPGSPPEMRADVELEIEIVTPSGRGPTLAHLYSGVLAQLCRYVTLKPGEAGIRYIRNLLPPNERPVFVGDDGTWRRDRWTVEFARFGSNPSVGVK